MNSFVNGIVKAAEKKDKSEKHYIRRALLGTPVSAAIEAKKGKKLESGWKSMKHWMKETAKGTGVGALAGLGIGALTRDPDIMARSAGAGAGLGYMAGNIKGHFDRESSRIHGENSKHKK